MLEKLSNFVDEKSESIGKFSSMLIFLMVFVVFFDVIARYVFSSPTNWGFEVAIFIYGIHFMLGGAICQKKRKHVEVDIIPKYLGARGKILLRFVSLIMVIVVCFAMVWFGSKWAYDSTLILEKSVHQTKFNPYIWWFKWLVPLSAFFVMAQASVDVFRLLGKTECDEEA